MTTPTRIATFLFQSALCLGLAAGPVWASPAAAKSQRDSHTLTREREGVERASDKQAAPHKATESQAKHAKSTAKPGQSARGAGSAR